MFFEDKRGVGTARGPEVAIWVPEFPSCPANMMEGFWKTMFIQKGPSGGFQVSGQEGNRVSKPLVNYMPKYKRMRST